MHEKLLLALLACAVVRPVVALKYALHDAMTGPDLAYYFHTDDENSVPDYDIVFLPEDWPQQERFLDNEPGNELNYSFSAFERQIDLKLKRNENIVAPNFKTYIHEHDGNVRYLNEIPANCHYLHREGDLVAALSICNPKSVQGLIFFDNSTFEIHPLTPNLQRLAKREARTGVPHIIKRAKFASEYLLDDLFPTAGNIWNKNPLYNDNIDDFFNEDLIQNTVQDNILHRKVQSMTAEIALFFDEAAYKIFGPFYGYDDKKLQTMLLAYINGVQALYHHPSLGTGLELVLVRLDIMKTQPREMPHYNGERSQLLDSFCEYQASINPRDDSNPDHWDMGLYVSGLDFFAYENGKKSGVTMGLATVGGVCLDKYACIIAEFGTTNVFGKPYPSAGFTSVYILAHEIGHNLGMHHDSSGNTCPKDGYIMSPSRGTNGETQWSSCSADVMAKLGWAKCLKDHAKPIRSRDHSRFLDVPGRLYTAKKQCEILLRDRDAVAAPNQQQSEICYNLQCKTPHRSGYYHAGPALDGTPCGSGKYCYGGHCSTRQLPKPVKVVPGGWSNWKEGTCSSGCIKDSKGIQMSTRQCNNPVPVNTDQGCEGSNRQFSFCSDNKLCKSKKEGPVDYASQKCKEFSTLLSELDPKGSGLQAPHEEARLWTSCAIFCKRKDSGVFYTPRIELNDLGVSPYFPDGTWCNRDNTGMDYYCIQHHCLPENFKFTKIQVPDLDDLPFSQNAMPNKYPIPSKLKDYFSIGPNGRPLKTSIKISDIRPPAEEDWETKDYVELPTIEQRFNALIQEMNDLDFF
ncbi:hypothetical protein GWI33_006323 [Rhynchophorus ferrugineus]|uniref:Peptidase M12B domain-containing protein n=1 Tax=Rhynchophorus ferrugineus TaxID=354439 RepID=A0A834IIV1_RHYFE|nr:hypothetical protein GWI33_006323 [Rhynchophorus ferrugineus]